MSRPWMSDENETPPRGVACMKSRGVAEMSCLKGDVDDPPLLAIICVDRVIQFSHIS